MKLIELLGADRVVIPLQAETVADAARELAYTMEAAGIVRNVKELDEFLGDYRAGTTVGQYAFVQHLRTDAVRAISAAIGMSPEPLRGEGGLTKLVHIMVLLVAPQKEASLFLQAINAFARLLSQDELVESMLEARDSEAVLGLQEFESANLSGYLTVHDLMSRRVLSVKGDMTLYEAASIMVSKNVPSLPVVSDTGEVLGMVSHREILRVMLPKYVKRMKSGEFVAARRRLPGEESDPRKIPVREVMDKSVLCISEEHTLADVATMMVNRDVPRFPVVRDGVLIGTLTRGEVVGKLFGP